MGLDRIPTKENKDMLTIVGTNGGFTLRSNKSSQTMESKKACFFTSSASRSDDPKRLSGFLRKS